MTSPSHDTYPPDPEKVDAMLADLDQAEERLTQSWHSIEKELEAVRLIKSGLRQLLEVRATEDMPSTHTTSAAHVGIPHETWDEYRELGHAIPDDCPASPRDLADIIEDYPIPEGAQTTKAWEIKKVRNLAALRLLAQRTTDEKFLLLDFAKLLCAVGLAAGPPKHRKTTLERHMQSEPEHWKNLGDGYWMFIDTPEAGSAENTSDFAEPVATIDQA